MITCCCSLSQVDHHVIVDMLPSLARAFFLEELPLKNGVSNVQVSDLPCNIRREGG